MVIIQTDRLILRKFTKNDTNFIYRLLNSPGWLKYIGSRGVTGQREAEAYINTLILPSYEKNNFGFYMMVRKDDNAEIGMCGLIKREGLDDVDIGFAVLPEYERQGYTSEAALATIAFAKDVIKLDRVTAITTKDNIASINVVNANMEKTG